MKHTVVLDVESYANWFLVAMKNVETQEVVTVECVDGPLSQPDRDLLRDIVENDLCITFNGTTYDMPVVWAAIAGRTAAELQAITHAIIVEGARLWEVERAWKFRTRSTDHIDLIEVAPLDASLKIYNGRLHGKRMQDLPFEPGSRLTSEQQAIVRDYCVNDLAATELLLSALAEPLALRDDMSVEYRQDLRSKSDAQIAEAVITKRIAEETGRTPTKPQVTPGTSYRYQVPSYIRFETPQFQQMLETVRNADYRVSEFGKVDIPRAVTDLDIKLGSSTYNMGNGGLHSCETRAVHVADENVAIIDRDVASYYPNIILTLGLKPQHLGEGFLTIYRKIVDERLAAKARVKEIKDELKALRAELQEAENG